jgi:hypothetical protein
MVEGLFFIFVISSIILLIAGLEERREIRMKIDMDFFSLRSQFEGILYCRHFFANRENDNLFLVRKSCKELLDRLNSTDLSHLYGVEEVVKNLRSGHRKRAHKALLVLEEEWKQKGFKIYGPCQCLGCKHPMAM